MRAITRSVATLVLVCGIAAADDPATKVVFVCEHGNVKSLMAASYFNQLAEQRGLPFHAVSRGVAPDSTTVPKPIVAGLDADGFDVRDFHPSKIAADDLADAATVVIISTALPADAGAGGLRVEHWNDVPPASTSYEAARSALKAHVAELLDRMAAHQAR